MFVCGTPLCRPTTGMDGPARSPNFQKAQELLKEAGYDGTPVVLMHSTDLQVLTNLAPVAKSLMEKAGFKVDMQSMDWQTLVARRAKKDPPNAGGWNAFLTSWVSADILNPVMAGFCQCGLRQGDVRLAVRRSRSRSCATISRAKPIRPSRRRSPRRCRCATREITTHLFLGQWYLPAAVRKNVDGMLTAPAPVFWNMEKKSQS